MDKVKVYVQLVRNCLMCANFLPVEESGWDKPICLVTREVITNPKSIPPSCPLGTIMGVE